MGRTPANITSASPNGTSLLGETGYNFSFLYQSNLFYCFINSGGNKISFSAPSYYGAWHQFAVVFNGATIQAYVDGSLVQPGASGATNTRSTFSGGFEIGGPGLLGFISNVRIYSRALSAAQSPRSITEGNSSRYSRRKLCHLRKMA